MAFFKKTMLMFCSVLALLATVYGGVGYGDSPMFSFMSEIKYIGQGISMSYTDGNIVVSPNPIVGSSAITFNVKKGATNPKVEIYSVSGSKIMDLSVVLGAQNKYETKWNGKDLTGKSLPAGMYYLKIKSGSALYSHKLIVTR